MFLRNFFYFLGVKMANLKGYIVTVRFKGQPQSFIFKTKKDRDAFIKDVLRDFSEVVSKSDIIYTTEKVDFSNNN